MPESDGIVDAFVGQDYVDTDSSTNEVYYSTPIVDSGNMYIQLVLWGVHK